MAEQTSADHTILDDHAASAGREFDRWLEAGRDQSMERGHGDVTRQLLGGWPLTGSHHLLDVGCGNGWAVREALSSGAGNATGVDASAAMIARASEGNGQFLQAAADRLPFTDDTFSHVLSVESLYYYADMAAALTEWARVAAPGARLGLILDLYQENPSSHRWVEALPVPVHLLDENGYQQLVARCGWRNVAVTRLHDRRPATPEAHFTASPYTPTYADYMACREAGSLALTATR